MAHPKTLALILAGGKGERLFPLTAMRSKPAVPFGGKYRIVDFVLSNLINSHIFSIYLLVQYKSQSLIEHVRQNWVLSPTLKNHFVAVVPPQMRMGPEWFQGTADAVFQNMNIIADLNPELVIVFGADHIYRMDIRQMIDFHLENGADATVAARPVPLDEASSFGIIATDGINRISGFLEKPKTPPHMPGRPDMAYASMGNYVFGRDVLMDALAKAQRKKQHDFGAHIIPGLVESGSRVFAYDFSQNVIPGTQPHEEVGYWRDVGSINAFFSAHMDLLGPKPKFELGNPQWPINSGVFPSASAKVIRGTVVNSILSEGVVIDGGRVKNSILRNSVIIEKGASVEECIIMDNVHIKKDSKLRRVIVDKSNTIEVGEQIGFDPAHDRFQCHMDTSGIFIIPKGGRRKRLRPK